MSDVANCSMNYPMVPAMSESIRPVMPGIHHVTAICGSPQRNVDFYTGVLGLRLVKKTVNFDDPTSYHLYYGDGIGSPGSIMTFFAWTNIPPMASGHGTQGTGEVVAAFAQLVGAPAVGRAFLGDGLIERHQRPAAAVAEQQDRGYAGLAPEKFDP